VLLIGGALRQVGGPAILDELVGSHVDRRGEGGSSVFVFHAPDNGSNPTY
jgi:hypothetical protein